MAITVSIFCIFAIVTLLTRVGKQKADGNCDSAVVYAMRKTNSGGDGFCFVIYFGLSFPRAAASRVLPVQEQNPVCILPDFEQLLIALDSRRFIGWT
jgi:hypothetical protein